jgi:mannose-6-phosphate isomerase-like protein (cupin superfamily)
MEVWHQTMAPGAATPVHRHVCEEVIVILAGSGRLDLEGASHDFRADSTLIVPPDAVHQIVNTGREDLVLVAALGAAPVRVRTGEGEPLPLPWQEA